MGKGALLNLRLPGSGIFVQLVRRCPASQSATIVVKRLSRGFLLRLYLAMMAEFFFLLQRIDRLDEKLSGEIKSLENKLNGLDFWPSAP